jgi:tRNA dimethylallyltransferase
MKHPTLIFIVGPTASGKSEIALALSSKLGAEIICCDAMQVYREVMIASDKPALQDRERVPHHLVDVVSVTEEFNVARFRQLALEAIREVQSRGKTALIVGGSGMYMSVLLDGIFEGIPTDEDLREELSEEARTKGPGVLHERLKDLDPEAAAKIHPNDPQRIIRALTVVLSTGQPLSKLQKNREGLWGTMDMKIVALNRPRQELYQRAEERIEVMFAKGIVEEIRKISALALSQSARKIIGVPEIMGHLQGEYDCDRAKYLMKLNTRHYIKRQLTWFRRDQRLTWIDIPPEQSPAQVVDIIVKML